MGEEKLIKKRILIVDDDARNTFALVSYLEMLEMEIYTAENGFEALDVLMHHEEIEVILMDIMMPGMDGFETIRRIKNDDRIAQIPVIAVTAKAMKGDREKCLEAGATDYISKPVDLKELIKKIEQLLS